MRKAAVALFLAAIPAFAQQPQQLRLPRVSPDQTLKQTVGLTDVTITYSRPGVHGRQIWGALVPYDKVWRTGANDATTITFSDDVTINGKPLPKGTYSLHTIPGRDQWTIIFNNVAKQWGSFNYDQTKDALRVTAKPESSPFHEWLTFDVPQLSADAATVAIRWEKIAVPFVVGTNTSQRVMTDIRSALAGSAANDWRTPYRAASFAIDNGLPVDDATKWLDQSLKAEENINNLYLKARLQARQGNRTGAMVTAERAISKAKPEDAEEVAEIRKTIDSWKAQK